MIEQGSLTKAGSKTHIQKQSDKEAKIPSEQINTGQSMVPKVGPMMKQPTFDWDTKDRYNELYHVFKSKDMPGIEKTALIKNWLSRKGFQLLEPLMLYNILLPINHYIGNSTTICHSRSMSDYRELTETFHQNISSYYKVIASAFWIFPLFINMLIMLLNLVYYHFLLKSVS